MANNNSVTPMMEQYFRIKEEHRDSLLFFRLGDFYEMFYEDAKIASAVLEITLTSRQKVPMCGVPYHAAESYLVKLLKNGFKVAVCEQVEDPKQAKGVVRREVVKVLTPGTAVELELRDSRESSYIASLNFSGGDWGLALIDLAAGEIRALQSSESEMKNLSDEIFRAAPKEILYPESSEDLAGSILAGNDMGNILKDPLEDWIFDPYQASSLIKTHFKVKSLTGFGFDEKSPAAGAVGALLYYLSRLRKDALSLVDRLSFQQRSRYMILDSASIKNLELLRNQRDGKRAGSFLDIIDTTVTSMGSRLIRLWLLNPLLDCREINTRLEAVENLLEKTIERQELRDSLAGILDLERLTGKITLGAANARDLVSLKKSIQPLPAIGKQLKAFRSEVLSTIMDRWDSAEDVAALIDESILDEPAFQLTEGGIIADGYNKELDELREISRSGKSVISRMEKKERERTGIGSLKIRYNKVFGYYIEVTKPNLPQIADDYIRRQTLVNSERFITPELKEYEDKVINAEQKIGELEYRLFQELREKVAARSDRLRRIAADLAFLDVLASFAETAARCGYRRPRVSDGDVLHIRSGRHPVIEVLNDEPFIPNDTYLDQESDQILIVTGPNMGGKSTFLRQVALICILAQMGSFVPADEAEIGVVDRIFTRIGAMDFLSVGQSTFMVEMLETANILNNATSQSLILLDEIGRGTSTFDGLSIAWAVAEHLHENERIRAKTLFATHYHELTELSLTLPRIKNYHVSVKEYQGDVIFLRKIVAGPSDQSYGIHVAKLAGIPRIVIDRAREILFNLEKKELDESGTPRIAYRKSARKDRDQMMLFKEDRERAQLEEIRAMLEGCDPARLTPIDALNMIHELKEKLKGKSG